MSPGPAASGSGHFDELTEAMGFTRSKPLCCTMLHYLLKALDGEAFEAAIADWLGVERNQPIAFDGKIAAGSDGNDLPGLHLLSAYDTETQTVLRSMPVDGGRARSKTKATPNSPTASQVSHRSKPTPSGCLR